MTSLEAIRHVVRTAGDAPIIASLGYPAYDLFAAGVFIKQRFMAAIGCAEPATAGGSA
jgi:hypothetical protein